MPTIFALCLGGLLTMAAAVCQAEDWGDKETEEEIKKLLKQLEDGSTPERDAAAARLAEIGEPAVPALKSAMGESKNRSVRSRSELILNNIARRSTAVRWKAFVKGDPKVSPGGWNNFREIVGDTRSSRALFIDMYETQRTLMETYGRDPAAAGRLLPKICENTFARSNRHSVPSLAALLIVAGDPKVELAPTVYAQLVELVRGSSLAKADKEGKNKLPRLLLAQFIKRPSSTLSPAAATVRIGAAMQFGLGEESVSIIVDVLSGLTSKQANQAGEVAFLLHALGRFGDETHLETIEPWLKDASEVSGQVQVRDMALMSLVELSGQECKDYGFLHEFKNKPWEQLHGWEWFHFDQGKERKDALTKWQQWSAEHLKTKDAKSSEK